MNRRFPRSRASGFTFVELIMSIVIIGIAVTGVLLVFTQTVWKSADPMIREQALAVAEAYLDEILSRHYVDPDGADGEGSRSLYDDVDDYDGLSETPTTPTGTSPATLSGYTVSVSVAATAIGPGGSTVPALAVNVTVAHGGSNIISLTGYRTSY